MLVLGASSGIGRAIANFYAARRARVCVVGRRKDKLDEVLRGRRVWVLQLVRVRDILEKGTNLWLFFSWMNPNDSVISL